ncbi:MAG TPA: tRNA (adenosine(37)-N6)-threonylcarbamoyltransferase complex ATPase subunit type 1 TsaE [Verrucomicrobiae bacterium]|nr:tRNA (adenosine(37)-N6)-threonylcarbamoyltransferase complex ATPase subunit type 1 TsaE [Verrucomicrobiae bacterium]
MKLISNSPDETISIGRKLGKIIKPGMVVCLLGDLGAGKTHFAKGVAMGMDIEDHVTSPTFTLINEYEGRLPFYHIDAYRLEDEEEAYELGIEEYLYGTGATLIEWPERLGGLIPAERLTVVISPGEGDDSRVMELKASGQAYLKLIEELKSDVHPGN